jgi:hypothetical protein
VSAVSFVFGLSLFFNGATFGVGLAIYTLQRNGLLK